MAKSNSTKSRVVKSPPMPDVVDHSKEWVVKESMFDSDTAALDYKSGVMTVPLAPTPKARAIRNREMLRLKFSPKTFPKLPPNVDPDIYRACETARVDYRGTRVGIHHDTRLLTDAQIEASSTLWNDKPQVAGAMLMMASGTLDQGIILNKLRGMVDDKKLDTDTYAAIRHAVEDAKYCVCRGKAPGPKQAIKAAQILTSQLTPPPPAPPEASGDGKSGPDGAEVAKKVEQGLQKMLAPHHHNIFDNSFKRKVDSLIADAEYKHGTKPEMVSLDKGDMWGDMHIWRPPRPLLFPARMKSKKWRPTDQGTVFRYPQRWLADQTGFAYKGIKEGGCSMLIDVSGSMSLSPADILAVMEAMPASLIATYSGQTTHDAIRRGGTRPIGKLTIVGEKGRRAEECNLRTGGRNNLVDGPALRWLAKQKGPRYWISDGGVTGRSGASEVSLYAECILICRQAHIMRIDSMAEVLELFGKYGKGR